MQIAGVIERSRATEHVELVCARCGLDRPGVIVRNRRQLSVLGVPIFPLDDGPASVRCLDCDHVSDLGVLDIPTTAQLSRMLEDATVSALAMVVWSTPGHMMLDVRRRATTSLTDAGIDDEELDRVVAHRSPAEAVGHLRALRQELTAHGKRGFLHRMMAVAGHADLPSTQHNVLVEIGCGIGMPAAHVNDVIGLVDDLAIA